MNKWACLILQILLLLLPLPARTGGSTGGFENEYLDLKESGRYREALKTLRRWTLAVADPVVREANIFRINELLVFPELMDDGIEAFHELKGDGELARDRMLAARMNSFLATLYLKKGMVKEAGDLTERSGWLDFSVLGPFPGGSAEEFDREHFTGKGYDAGKIYEGKNFQVSWISGALDRRGVLNIRDLLPDATDSLFYFRRIIPVPRDGEYRFLFGKTGFTDILLDGKKIFSSRERHEFHHDQYLLKVWLPAGSHEILVKAGDTGGSLQFAFRVTDGSGRPLIPGTGGTGTAPEGARLMGWSLFPTLASLAAKGTLTERESFLAGYLACMSNLSGDDNSAVLRYFSAVAPGSRLYPAALYYSGRSEKSQEKRERYFLDAAGSGGPGMDPLIEIIRHKLSTGFYYEAFPLIGRIRDINRDSVYYHWFMGKLMLGKGWHTEAVRHGEKLLESAYPSLGHMILQESRMAERKYRQAIESLRYLAGMDMYNRDLAESLAAAYRMAGLMEEALRTEEALSFTFPADVNIRTGLSRSVETLRGPGEALPWVASALKRSPFNNRALLRAGELYHRMGNRALAKYYHVMASRYDPDNYGIRRYLALLGDHTNEIAPHLFAGDIAELAARGAAYRHEAAVVLLSETGIRVFTDGSHEKWVRTAVMINDESAVKNFSTQYIVLDPSHETMEELNCSVVNDGARTESPAGYRKSLSDPESRLYYNLEALTVPVQGLRKGSVMEISYRVKNRGGREYHNYFGEKIIIGGEYRTLMTNIVVSHRKGKEIFLHAKGIDERSVERFTAGETGIYRISLENRAPYEKERSMPHYTRVLPAVFFTSHRNWDEASSWYRSLLRNRGNAGPEMKKALEGILSPDDSGLRKAEKIYRHVTNTIRYVGFEFGIGGMQPREAGETYASRMGDCKDITMVLVAMMREAGLDARLALVRTRDRGRAWTGAPFIGEFNHAICFVRIRKPQGGYAEFFMDGTAGDTGFRELPEEVSGVTALVIDSGGFSFRSTAGEFYIPAVQQVFTRVVLDGKGNARLERTLTISGNAAPDVRGDLKNSGKKLIMLNEYWGRRFPGSQVRDLVVMNAGTGAPVSYRYVIEVPALAQAVENELIFRAFLMPSDLHRSFGISRERIHPLSLSSRMSVRVSVEYVFPAGFRLRELPENLACGTGTFRCSFTYEKGAAGLLASSVIEISESEIPRDDFEKFRDFSRAVNRKEQERIVLVRQTQ